MSTWKNFEMDKSEESLPFKVFEPRSSSRFRSESVSSSSTSKLNLTVGSPVMSSSPHQFPGINTQQQLLSPGCLEEGAFDFTGLRRLSPRTLPSELLLASSSPSGFSTLMNQDLLQMMPENTSTNPMMTGFSGDPNLPKRLHVSNIPYRYR